MEKAIQIAEELESFINCYNPQCKVLVEQLSKMHKTLQQCFMREVIMEFIKQEADNYKKGFCDDRNRATGEFCNKIMEMAEKEEVYFPFI